MIRVHFRAALLCAAMSPMSAWAATYCVSPNPTAPDEVSLSTAIANWRNAFYPVTIKLQQGTYTSLVGNLADAGYTDLSLLGGYYAVAGDSCGGRALNAKNAVVQGSLKILDIEPTSLTVEGMTFSGYGSILLASGKMTLLSEMIVTGGSSSSGIALTFGAYDGGVATLQNSLVYGNHMPGGAVRATYNPGFAEAGNTVYLINDTIAGNDAIRFRSRSSASTTSSTAIRAPVSRRRSILGSSRYVFSNRAYCSSR